jgi:phenylacetate-CoA ligase
MDAGIAGRSGDGMTEALTEAQRYPLMTEDGRRLLRWLHECDYAPRYNHHCGPRLTAEGLGRVQAFEAEVRRAPPRWAPGTLPTWVPEFTAFCLRDVPFYRRYGPLPERFADLPSCRRANLSRGPWSFVPDSQPLDDLIVYCTSGTTGHPLNVLSHPETAACYLPLLRAALGRHGVTLAGGAGTVACLLICFQQSTFTYATVSPFLDFAGFAKINLNRADWRQPEAVAKFIDACHPEIFTGDPLSFAELAQLPLSTGPKALVSTAMALLPGLRQALTAHFGCPVLDTYSLNEAGLVAVVEPSGGLGLLQPRLYVEILDEDDRPCPPGVRGEIALTGGYNPFVPLLRYRTGDYACLVYEDDQPVLMDLEGRPPTTFRTPGGAIVNNVDVSLALRDYALPRFTLHQAADGALRLRLPGEYEYAQREQVRAALLQLFGADQHLTIEDLAPGPPSGKLIQYTSDYAADDRA